MLFDATADLVQPGWYVGGAKLIGVKPVQVPTQYLSFIYSPG